MNSSMLSIYLIRKHLDPYDLVDWIYKLCAEAARRMHDGSQLQSIRARDARHALGTLLMCSNLCDFLTLRSDRDNLIEHLYSQCPRNEDINDEPLYWLQYSILKQAQ